MCPIREIFSSSSFSNYVVKIHRKIRTQVIFTVFDFWCSGFPYLAPIKDQGYSLRFIYLFSEIQALISTPSAYLGDQN